MAGCYGGLLAMHDAAPGALVVAIAPDLEGPKALGRQLGLPELRLKLCHALPRLLQFCPEQQIVRLSPGCVFDRHGNHPRWKCVQPRHSSPAGLEHLPPRGGGE
jgi:hypothetical protein